MQIKGLHESKETSAMSRNFLNKMFSELYADQQSRLFIQHATREDIIEVMINLSNIVREAVMSKQYTSNEKTL